MSWQIYCWYCGKVSEFYVPKDYEHETETLCRDCMEEEEKRNGRNN